MSAEKKKKILIISVKAGFGHSRAGDALLDYAKENLPEFEVRRVNIEDIDPIFKIYGRIYDFLTKRFPTIWGAIYKNEWVIVAMKKTFFLKGLINQKIKRLIKLKRPDIVIFANVTVLSLLPFHLEKVLPHTMIATLVTDYHGHPYYSFPSIDYYFVADGKVAEDLERAKVKREKIIISGIPINPRFYIKQNVKKLKSKYGINNDDPVVLFIASFKISRRDLVKAVDQLLKFEPKINLIFVASGNDVFYNLIKNNFSAHKRLFLANWTNVIEEYIKISDVIISKAGGLTVSECLTLKKPMIVVNPIPGQEEYNAEFVAKNNFGKRIKNIDEIVKILPEMLLYPKNNQTGLIPKENPSEKIFQYFK